MNKLLYFILGIVLIIGGLRIISTKTYEFRYYTALELGKYSTAVGLLIVSIGLVLLYLGYILKEQKIEFSKCQKCKENYRYSELKDGMCPTCNVKTIEMDEYYKKYPDDELEDV